MDNIKSLYANHLHPRKRNPTRFASYVALSMSIIIFAVQNKTVYTFVKYVQTETIMRNIAPVEFYQPLKDPFTANGVTIFEVPEKWNRFQTPWFRPPTVLLKISKESNYRYLYSSARLMTSDGIGHSMGTVNYELNMALRMNLTYTHRVAIYSSLSRKDPQAVEKFFGWGDREIPRTLIQKEGCNPENGSWPKPRKVYVCRFCKTANKNGSMGINELITIPDELGPRCTILDPNCKENTTRFLAAHSRSHTVFQLPDSTCSPPASDSNYLQTKDFFYHKYWDKHGRLPWLGPLNDRKEFKTVDFNQQELNVAIHVRRGDFLEPKTRVIRQVTDDSTFANLFRDAMVIVQEVGGAFADMKVAVHIYSEGKLIREGVSSTHSVDMQDKQYYDANGIPRDAVWWKYQISNSLKSQDTTLPVGFENRFRVVLHISDDTLTSLHEMISADIFIGSVSGLSVNLVWSLARGVLLVPHYTSINNERGKKGIICCSVPFQNDNGMFAKEEFKQFWEYFSTANVKSARRQLSHKRNF